MNELEKTILKQFTSKSNEIIEIKRYLLDAIHNIKEAYDYDVDRYKDSSLLAAYTELLIKMNQLEVMEI